MRRLLLLSLGLPLLALADLWLWSLPPSPWLLGLSHYLVRPALFLVLLFAGMTGLLFVSHHPGRMMGEPDRTELARGPKWVLRGLSGLALAVLLAAVLGALPPWAGLLAFLFLSPFGALPTTLANGLGIALGLVAWLYAVFLAGLVTPFAACLVHLAYPLTLVVLVTFVGAVLPAPLGHPLGGRRAHGWCLVFTAGFLLFLSRPFLQAATTAQCQDDRIDVLVSLPPAPRPDDVPAGLVLESEPVEPAHRRYHLRCTEHPEAGESTFLERVR